MEGKKQNKQTKHTAKQFCLMPNCPFARSFAHWYEGRKTNKWKRIRGNLSCSRALFSSFVMFTCTSRGDTLYDTTSIIFSKSILNMIMTLINFKVESIAIIHLYLRKKNTLWEWRASSLLLWITQEVTWEKHRTSTSCWPEWSLVRLQLSIIIELNECLSFVFLAGFSKKK